MCNVSFGIYLDGVARGMVEANPGKYTEEAARKIAEDTYNTLFSLVQKKIITAKQASELNHMSEEDFVTMMTIANS